MIYEISNMEEFLEGIKKEIIDYQKKFYEEPKAIIIEEGYFIFLKIILQENLIYANVDSIDRFCGLDIIVTRRNIGIIIV